jgi:carbamate kinase
MGPKVESVLRFLRAGGRQAIITSQERLADAVTGWAGTHIVPDAEPDETANLHEELATQVDR